MEDKIFYNENECVMCGNHFLTYKENGKRGGMKKGQVIRSSRCITCSNICSKRYFRLYHKLNLEKK